MSFLSGIMDIGRSTVSFLSGNSIASSLVKTAGMALIVSQMNKNNKSNDIPTGSSAPPNIDEGVRLQIPPASDRKIPVLYGAGYFSGNITDAVMSNNNRRMTYCITLCEKTGVKLSDSQASQFVFKDIYWNDQRIIFKTDGITIDYTVDRDGTIDRSLSELVKVWCYRGNSTSGVIPENYSGSVPPAYSVMPEWASGTHPMSDLVFAIIEVNYNRERNVTGLGTVMFHIENSMSLPGDVLYDYMTNTRYGAGIATAEILAS
jgi:hypothetical protein